MFFNITRVTAALSALSLTLPGHSKYTGTNDYLVVTATYSIIDGAPDSNHKDNFIGYAGAPSSLPSAVGIFSKWFNYMHIRMGTSLTTLDRFSP